jgi:hypothetical protein
VEDGGAVVMVRAGWGGGFGVGLGHLAFVLCSKCWLRWGRVVAGSRGGAGFFRHSSRRNGASVGDDNRHGNSRCHCDFGALLGLINAARIKKLLCLVCRCFVVMSRP